MGIYLSIGNNGILTRAKEAKELTNKQEATDIINLKITTAQMHKYAEEERMPTLKELSITLSEDSEIQYVTETSKLANAEYSITSENPSSIFTKLNKYPYEFEINGQLQLASIDGIKLATANQIQSNMMDLWENPSPTASFPAQTITWGGENPSSGAKEGAGEYEYNYLMIEYNGGSKIVSKGASVLLNYEFADFASDLAYYHNQRQVTYVDNITLKFENTNTLQINKGNHAQFNWNYLCIPLKIIGIK